MGTYCTEADDKADEDTAETSVETGAETGDPGLHDRI